MSVKLFESELKVMEVLWKEGELAAKEIAQRLKEQVSWSKTTTYTVLKKCVEKGAVRGFCAARLSAGKKCRRQQPRILLTGCTAVLRTG